MTTTIEPTAGNHHLDGDLAPSDAATPSPPSLVDPELPKPGEFADRRTAGEIADYALAKLRRYVEGSSEISSHFIELSIRLGDLYARLGEAPPAQPKQTKAEDTPAAEPDKPQQQFAVEEQEAAIEQLTAPEPT